MELSITIVIPSGVTRLVVECVQEQPAQKDPFGLVEAPVLVESQPKPIPEPEPIPEAAPISEPTRPAKKYIGG